MSELPIETLKGGRYRIERVLGAGGMSVVFMAMDNRIGVQRAIKLLLPKYAQNARIRERFENEAYAQAGLRHPNILMVHDVVEEDIGVYLVMELAEQGSLAGRVKSLGPMSPQETAQVGITMASALAVAHAEGVIHRDIKPENVLVDRLGNIKIADFGIARVVARQHDMTRTGTVMGTWAYMPPEQRDSARQVDGRSDIYALGASLYFLTTGRQPFDLHATESHAAAFEGFPPALAAVIKQATRYSAADRYATCEELQAALAAIVQDLPTEPFVDFDPPTEPPETHVPELGDLSTYIAATRGAAGGGTAVPDLAGGGTAVPSGSATFFFDGPSGEHPVVEPPAPDAAAGGGATLVADVEGSSAAGSSAAGSSAAGASAAGSSAAGASAAGSSAAGSATAGSAAGSAAAPGPAPSHRPAVAGSQLVIFTAGVLAAVLAVVVLLPRLIQPPQPTQPAPATVEPALEAHAAAAPAQPEPAATADGTAADGTAADGTAADGTAADGTATTGSAAGGGAAGGGAAGGSAARTDATTGSDKPEPRIITIQPLATAEVPTETPETSGTTLSEPTGTVVVKTVPSGATVRVAGQALVRAGRGYELPVGSHLLEIESAAGEVHRTPVSVSRGGVVEICYSFDTNSACSEP